MNLQTFLPKQTTRSRLKIYLIVLAILLLTACGPEKLIGFQFRLTDSAGNPITGTRDVTINLYTGTEGDPSSFEIQFSETHSNVSITDGLANLEIGSVEDLDPALFARPLWLEVEVDGETLAPMQKMLGSPYAMSLVGGAVVGSAHIGDGSDGTDENYGTLSVVASGANGSALVVGTVGDGDFIRACDSILGDRDCPTLAFQLKNDGSVFTAADTQIAVSPLDMVADYQYAADLEFDPPHWGYMVIRPITAGTRLVYIPVDLPITLLGTPQKLSKAEICYEMDDAADVISLIEVQVLTETGGGPDLLFDSSDYASTIWDCLELSTTTPEVITGPLFLHIAMNFSGAGADHKIRIGKIVLTLTED